LTVGNGRRVWGFMVWHSCGGAIVTRVCRKCSKAGDFEDQKADPSVPIAAYKSCKIPAYTKGRPKLGGFYAGATVVETSEASAFLKAVASAFNEDKDKLKTVLNDKFNPVRRDELAAEAVTAATPVGSAGASLVLGPDGFFDGRIFDPDRLDEYLASF
ncbi:MAG: hypothetical protein ACK4N1_18780, partial [Pseudorhizobium sp.]